MLQSNNTPKRCTGCEQHLSLESFSKDRTRPDGFDPRCKRCRSAARALRRADPNYVTRLREEVRTWKKRNRHKVREYKRDAASRLGYNTAEKARREAAKIQAAPAWCDRAAVRQIYTAARTHNALNPYNVVHVDHIVPLRSPLVCGLHVPWNLQLLPADENIAKSNQVWPDMWDTALGLIVPDHQDPDQGDRPEAVVWAAR